MFSRKFFQLAFLLLIVDGIVIPRDAFGQVQVMDPGQLDSLPGGYPLHSLAWDFFPGSVSVGEQTAMDTGHFRVSSTNFGWRDGLRAFKDTAAVNLPWEGHGWFRLQIFLAPELRNKLLAIRLNQDGASRIFWDDQPLAAFGDPGVDPAGADATGFRGSVPVFEVVPLVANDSAIHTLVVEYTNRKMVYPGFAGFQVWLGTYEQLDQYQRTNYASNQSLTIGCAIAVTLALLHLFLFAFYPRQRLNLYYSLFVFCNALTLFGRYLQHASSVPSSQMLGEELFYVAIGCIPLTCGLLLYTAGQFRRRRLRIGILLVLTAGMEIALAICFNRFSLGLWWSVTNVFFLAVSIDGLAGLIRQARKSPAAWLIVTGMLLECFLSLAVGSDLFGWFGNRYWIIIQAMAIVILILPVFFSIYLALDFARTNKRLEVELAHNAELAQRNLAQEREKIRMVEEQAAQLEVTVRERTFQLQAQTERLRLQTTQLQTKTEELQERTEQLRELDRVKSRFFINLTHEFRTPLSLILGPARQLSESASDQSARAMAILISSNANKLLILVNQLLDLSKLESGMMEVVETDLDLMALTAELVEGFAPALQERKVSLRVESSYRSLWMHTDAAKMEMILRNLVSNAIKFNHPGGTVVISVNVDPQRAGLEIQVTDNGVGIDPVKIPLVFNRFYQADPSDTRSQEGSGIGLSLTRELVELLGGSVDLQSEPKKGTRVAVSLPLLPAKEAVDELLEQPGHTPVHAGAPGEAHATQDHFVSAESGSLPQILVIEDNAELRAFVSTVLNPGYRVMEASGGVEGVELARERVPDLVITDLMMPGMDGFEVSRVLRQSPASSHIPILMLTARTDTASKTTGWMTGADGYMTKPFDAVELRALAANLIRTRRALLHRSKMEWKLGGDEVLPSMDQEFLRRVREVISEFLDDPQLGVDFLAARINLSRTQLHRKLKAIIDQTPGDLIRMIRLERAHDLLAQRAGTVAEVGYLVGFGNPANFSTSFSRHFGYPPSEVPPGT